MQYHQYLEGWPEKKIVLLVQGSHSGNLLWSFELSRIVNLQWLIARVEMHHKKTHNETHNEIPSQFLQALQYLWVWGKWDLLVRWLRRHRCGEIMAASWLFGDFYWFYIDFTGSVHFCSLLWNCSLLVGVGVATPVRDWCACRARKPPYSCGVQSQCSSSLIVSVYVMIYNIYILLYI